MTLFLVKAVQKGLFCKSLSKLYTLIICMIFFCHVINKVQKSKIDSDSKMSCNLSRVSGRGYFWCKSCDYTQFSILYRRLPMLFSLLIISFPLNILGLLWQLTKYFTLSSEYAWNAMVKNFLFRLQSISNYLWYLIQCKYVNNCYVILFRKWYEKVHTYSVHPHFFHVFQFVVEWNQ